MTTEQIMTLPTIPWEDPDNPAHLRPPEPQPEPPLLPPQPQPDKELKNYLLGEAPIRVTEETSFMTGPPLPWDIDNAATDVMESEPWDIDKEAKDTPIREMKTSFMAGPWDIDKEAQDAPPELMETGPAENFEEMETLFTDSVKNFEDPTRNIPPKTGTMDVQLKLSLPAGTTPMETDSIEKPIKSNPPLKNFNPQQQTLPKLSEASYGSQHQQQYGESYNQRNQQSESKHGGIGLIEMLLLMQEH